MWTCVSRRRLRAESAVGAGLLATSAALFAFAQGRGWVIGGAIAAPKLFWLCYTLFAWFLLPPLIARDSQAAPSVRRGYRIFFWNMSARGAAELAMMYVWRNWDPRIGAVHDVASIGLILFLFQRARPAGAFDRRLIRHAFVLAAMLALETSFALYFASNFATQGDRALYFVPDDERYSDILMVTTVAVTCLTLYFPVFLRGWLYGPDESRS